MIHLGVIHDDELGTIVSVFDSDGELTATGSAFADGQHRNHPCAITPVMDAQ